MCVRVCVFACLRVCVCACSVLMRVSCCLIYVQRSRCGGGGRGRRRKSSRAVLLRAACLPACLYFPWLVTLLRLMNSERDLPASIGSSQLAANGGVVRAGKQQSPAPVSGGWVGVWLAGCGSADSPRLCRATRVHASAQKATDSIVILWVVLSVFIVKINKLINK